jgi:hypothetical protein
MDASEAPVCLEYGLEIEIITICPVPIIFSGVIEEGSEKVVKKDFGCHFFLM